MSAKWTAAQKKLVAEQMTHIKRVADLLSPEERASLYADLAEMARLRRKAEAESRNVEMS